MSNNQPASHEPEARPVVVIAGGSGFIGRRLAAELGGTGHEVVILSRAAPRPAVGPVRFVQWNARPSDEPQPWEAELAAARAVVNLCGESIGGPRWTARRKATLIDSRVLPSRALVEAINRLERPPALLLQASGVGYYGAGNKAVDESGGAGDDFLAGLARQWEAPLADLRPDVRSAITRFGVVLGRTGGALAQMLMPFRLFVGGPIAGGNQWLSWIHLQDAAAILALLIGDEETRGIYNVVAPNPVRNVQFSKAAGATLNRPSIMFTPRFLLKTLLGEQSTLVCDGQQVVSRRLRNYEFRFPTMEDALRDAMS